MRWEEGVEDWYEVCGDVKKEGRRGLVYELESRSRRASALSGREDQLTLAVGRVLGGGRYRGQHLSSGRDKIPALIHVHQILRVRPPNSSCAHPNESRPILQLGKRDERARREFRECILGKEACGRRQEDVVLRSGRAAVCPKVGRSETISEFSRRVGGDEQRVFKDEIALDGYGAGKRSREDGDEGVAHDEEDRDNGARDVNCRRDCGGMWEQ
jgi:hypothetical protein